MRDAELRERLARIKRTVEAEGYALTSVLRPAADPADVASAEAWFQVDFPASFREFLAIHDGIEITIDDASLGFEVMVDRLRILGASEMVRYRSAKDDESPYKGQYPLVAVNKPLFEGGVPFGSYEGGSNFFLFDSSRGGTEYPIVEAYSETNDPWEVIAGSFVEFLSRLLDHAERYGNFKYWLATDIDGA